MPQTKWIIAGERMFGSSIEEVIGDVLKRELGAVGMPFRLFKFPPILD